MYNMWVNYKDYFKDKKIAIVGLGPHGEMLADIKFLLKNKAQVSLYDMRSEERVSKYVLDLPVGGCRKFSFGKIDGDELLDEDIIILSPEVSKKSNFLKKASSAGKQIEFIDTMFLKLIPPITLIGVIGSYGKSVVSHLIYSVLKKAFALNKDQGLFFIDSDLSGGTLNNLKKINKGDVVICRIPEYLMEYYHKLRISPHVAVITSVVPFDILEFQTYNNFVIASDEVIDAIKKHSKNPSKAKILRTYANSIPAEWNMAINNIHDKENAALVLQTAELFKVSTDIVREVLQNFTGLKGHIELVKRVGGVEYYNDTNSVHPLSTLNAIKTLSSNKNLILIMGGAYTGYDYDHLIDKISNYVSTIILLPGSGTVGLRSRIDALKDVTVLQALDLEKAVETACDNAQKGEIVLFSPSFEAVGVDLSKKERGERFVRAVRSLS